MTIASERATPSEPPGRRQSKSRLQRQAHDSKLVIPDETATNFAGTGAEPSRRREFDPAIQSQREKWMLLHPISTRDYVIVTPPIEAVWQIIAETLATRRLGCTFGAHPRFGKSSTIRYLVPSLRAAFPKLVVHKFVAETHKPNSEPQFYATIGGIRNFRGLKYKDRYAVPGIIYKKLLISALESESKTLAMFGDEMQRFTQDDWTWLIDLSNRLEQDGVRMICISFGQPELASFRNIQKSIGRVDILGRFMTRFYVFDGISSASSLAKVLACYDDPECVEFPPGSGCSYTEFFYPHQFSQGTRLAQNAEELWREFEFAGREVVSFTGPLSIGMEWVTLAVEHLLIKGCDSPSSSLRFTKAELEMAVRASGFSEAIGISYMPGTDPRGV